MGGAKQEWIEYQESEAMYDWIEDNYGSDAGEEGSDSWNEAVAAFEQYCTEQEEKYYEMMEQDEYDYYLYLTFKDIDSIFKKDISELKIILNSSNIEAHNPTFYKMVYAHSITILEVYLEDLAKSLLMTSEQLLKNTINNVKPFCDNKYKLNEISLGSDGIKKFVLGKLSDNLFHDIPKAINIFNGILDKKLNIKLNEICNITSVRHDIVHRNGKNKEGETLTIDAESTLRAIKNVELFANELRVKL